MLNEQMLFHILINERRIIEDVNYFHLSGIQMEQHLFSGFNCLSSIRDCSLVLFNIWKPLCIYIYTHTHNMCIYVYIYIYTIHTIHIHTICIYIVAVVEDKKSKSGPHFSILMGTNCACLIFMTSNVCTLYGLLQVESILPKGNSCRSLCPLSICLQVLNI